MINFSLILPSRERVYLLEDLLFSIQQRTFDLSKIEVWVAIDHDDSGTLSQMKRLRGRFPFLEFFVTDRQDNFQTGYYDRLARISTGRYIQILNDDCLFVTGDWDKIALDRIKEIPVKAFYGLVRDSSFNVSYSCFPLISREWFSCVGFVSHSEFPTWGADIWLHQVASQLGRVHEMPYEVQHISHHNGKRARDQVNVRMEQLQSYNWHCAEGEAHRIKNVLHANGY